MCKVLRCAPHVKLSCQHIFTFHPRNLRAFVSRFYHMCKVLAALIINKQFTTLGPITDPCNHSAFGYSGLACMHAAIKPFLSS